MLQALERKEQEGVSKQDLLGALMFGADRIFTTDSGDMPTDEELAQLLASARYRVAEPKEANEGKEMEAGDASQSAIPQHSAEQAAASKPPSDNVRALGTRSSGNRGCCRDGCKLARDGDGRGGGRGVVGRGIKVLKDTRWAVQAPAGMIFFSSVQSLYPSHRCVLGADNVQQDEGGPA